MIGGNNKKYIHYSFFLLLSPCIIIIYTTCTAKTFHYSQRQAVQEWFAQHYPNNKRTSGHASQVATKYQVLDVAQMEFYGQKNGEYKPDQVILYRYFRIPPVCSNQITQGTDWSKTTKNNYYFRIQGTFVELGALDGLLYSNTLALEKYLNWTGVLIEPVPSNYRKLKLNRPRVTTIHSAVCKQIGKMTFLGNGATAGSTETMSQKHRKKFQNKWDFLHQHEYDVPCEPLASIFQRLGIQHVDFLSIDVEGAEWTVLESISFSTVSIAVIMIELDGTNRTKDEHCRQLLRENNYQYDFRLAANEYWYHPQSLQKSVLQGAGFSPVFWNNILT